MRRLLPGLPWLSAITAVVIVVGGFLAARSETVQALLGRWSFVKSVTNDNSTYYRLKVKLAYKGEPQDFDIVVGCNVHQIIYKDNSRTYEAGLIPTVFGRRMSDGKALVVRPPKACRGETTANGRVQPDLLPLIIVYDNADALEFGIAYLSEDAYTSPLSVLKFGGATIEEATRSDFDHFRKTQANAVRRELYHSALDSDQLLRQLQLKRGPRTWAHVCEGYERYLLGDGGRSLLREHWPEGQPKYWQASYAVEDALGKMVFDRRTPIHSDSADRAAHVAWSFSDGAADLGLPTRTGGGLVSTSRGYRFAEAYYPAASDYRADRWPAANEQRRDYLARLDHVADMRIQFQGGSTRGFAYCFSRTFPDDELRVSLADLRRVGMVDGEVVFAARAPILMPIQLLRSASLLKCCAAL